MIQPNELRVGNFVCRKDLGTNETRFEQIIYLSEKTTTTGPIKVVCGYEDIAPIPLAEEWLIKFGFKKIAGSEGYYWQKSKVDSKDSFNEHFRLGDASEYFVPFGIDDYQSVDVKYVHQLQNLYFALTGEELQRK